LGKEAPMNLIIKCKKCQTELRARHIYSPSLAELIIEVEPCSNPECHDCHNCEIEQKYLELKRNTQKI
jgi:hypothetical protein